MTPDHDQREARRQQQVAALAAPPLDATRFHWGPRHVIEALRRRGFTDDQVRGAIERGAHRALAEGFSVRNVLACFFVSPERERAGRDPLDTFPFVLNPQARAVITGARHAGYSDTSILDLFVQAFHEARRVGRSPDDVWGAWFVSSRGGDGADVGC